MRETKKLFTPLGVDHIVFACYDRHFWQRVFERFGFKTVHSAMTKSDRVVPMVHGNVRILLVDPDSTFLYDAREKITRFLLDHGDMQVFASAISVDDIKGAIAELTNRGQKIEDTFVTYDKFEWNLRAIHGFTLHLPFASAVTWQLVERVQKAQAHSLYLKSQGVDHFAIGVQNLKQWEDFYHSLGFETIYAPPHDRIKGEYSGMKTVAMQRDGWVVALVEGVDSNDLPSQVTTYVKAHGDHAIQHAAIGFSDLYATFEELRKRQVQFRLRRAKNPGANLEANDVIHVGEDHSGPLFQCFTKPWARRGGEDDPNMSQSGFFFELIQRISTARKAEALESQAFDDRTVIGLFNSIEREQVENDTTLVFPDERMENYRFQGWLAENKKTKKE
jgi:4-hydroxyphenylpyruvate dioxygenase